MTARLMLLAVLVASPAYAQSGSRGSDPLTASRFVGSGFGGRTTSLASTALESGLQGAAIVASARGRAALDRARAQLVLEEARAGALRNRYENAELNYKLRKAQDARRQASLAEKAGRLASRRERAVSGELTSLADQWPLAFQANRYRSLRAEAEGLVALRNRLGDDNFGTTTALDAVLDEILAQLEVDAEIISIDQAEFNQAVRFVRGIPSRYYDPVFEEPSKKFMAMAMP